MGLAERIRRAPWETKRTVLFSHTFVNAWIKAARISRSIDLSVDRKVAGNYFSNQLMISDMVQVEMSQNLLVPASQNGKDFTNIWG